jgi:hypothetical protein
LAINKQIIPKISNFAAIRRLSHALAQRVEAIAIMIITFKPIKRSLKRKPLTPKVKLAIPKPITRTKWLYSIHRKQKVLIFYKTTLFLSKRIYTANGYGKVTAYLVALTLQKATGIRTPKK